MTIETMQEQDALTLWKKALSTILEKGTPRHVQGQKTFEVENMVVKLVNVEKSNIDMPINILARNSKEIYSSKEEMIGIMFKREVAPAYDYTYGERMFQHSGTKNQIDDFIIPLLKKSPDTRRAIINLYDPVQDADMTNRNTPGIIYINLRLDGNNLDSTVHIRSNDILYGFPASIYQAFIIQEYIAKKLEVSCRNLVVMSNSAHVYEDHLSLAKEIIK